MRISLLLILLLPIHLTGLSQADSDNLSFKNQINSQNIDQDHILTLQISFIGEGLSSREMMENITYFTLGGKAITAFLDG